MKINEGDRVPMSFYSDAQGRVRPLLGIGPDPSGAPVGAMRALIFWRYLVLKRLLDTSTGYFRILMATTITEREWSLAKETSFFHLMLLMHRANVGQLG
jgi:hypothetical protein